MGKRKKQITEDYKLRAEIAKNRQLRSETREGVRKLRTLIKGGGTNEIHEQ